MSSEYRHGQFVWREMMCPPAEVEKAKAFYGELLGWSFGEMNMMPGMTYTLCQVGGRPIGGIFPSPPEMGPPAWMSYVSVSDVDDTVRASEARGGNTVMKPDTVAGIGRFAVINDPTGGFLGVMHGESGDGPAPGMPAVGEFCWETLGTTDVDKARAFYTEVIGWNQGAGPDAGMVVFAAGATQVADIEKVEPGMPSHWLCHVVAGPLEPAREKAAKLGATILVPVIDIPHVGRICIIKDPAGAVISLFEPAAPAA